MHYNLLFNTFDRIRYLFIFVEGGALQVPQQYYVNADITNRAGRRVSLVWRDDIIEFDISDGATFQFRYKVLTYMIPPPVYKFFAVRYGTNVSDLINKGPYLDVPATSAPSNVTNGICSSSKSNISIFMCKFEEY